MEIDFYGFLNGCWAHEIIGLHMYEQPTLGKFV
jgi:hypothetical protein